MNPSNERRTTPEYWARSYDGVEPLKSYDPGDIERWMRKYIPPVREGETKTCLEIGCYPGAYLAAFADMGYVVSGIDFCDKVGLLPEALAERGGRVGKFWCEDFFTFDPPTTFDVVYSVGFVEHFENYEEVIARQARLVGDGGYLVVQIPNFAGTFQHWLHYHFDRAGYRRHYIPSMHVNEWPNILKPEEFEILYVGYFGKFLFWISCNPKELGYLKRMALRAMHTFRLRFGGYLPENKKAYAPFGGLVARRRMAASGNALGVNAMS